MHRSFLVVEPQASDRERLAAALARLEPGCRVECAASGADALGFLDASEDAPSLVLYNHATPDLPGISFLAEVRGRTDQPVPPVAILAASLTDQQIINCYRLGAVAVIDAPARNHELRDTIKGFARPAHRPGSRRTSAA